MKILLIGEYSRLHNSLKEGLEILGHDVQIIGTRDGFKNLPVDVDVQSRYFITGFGLLVKRIVAKISNIDLQGVERGIRFYLAIKRGGHADVVQLINEESIKAGVKFEIFLIKEILKRTKKLFLLSSGTDYVSVAFAHDKKFKYSLLTPYFNGDAKNDKTYAFVLKFITPPFIKLHNFLYKNCNGVIATDFDYHIPLIGNPKYLGIIPNPINLDLIPFNKIKISGGIKIFHGINTGNFYKKGNYIFEKALEIIKKKYPDKVEVFVVTNVPYEEYIKLYEDAHIIMDQVFAYDQGYNALESMARGKVVFTGAEEEFLDYYKLKKNEVCVNALPDIDEIVKELEYLIENPTEIVKTGFNARKFVEKHHDYVAIAEKYLTTWRLN